MVQIFLLGKFCENLVGKEEVRCKIVSWENLVPRVHTEMWNQGNRSSKSQYIIYGLVPCPSAEFHEIGCVRAQRIRLTEVVGGNCSTMWSSLMALVAAGL